jgi:hypothetical protein
VPKSKSKDSAGRLLPKGFKAIEHQGNFWKGNRVGDSIEGKLIKVAVKHFPAARVNGVKYQERDANVYTLSTATGSVEVTQSGGLGALTQVKKGQTVYIAFVRMKKLPGKSPMREYIVGVK